MMQKQHDDDKSPKGERQLASTSTGELVGRLAEGATELVKKEIELAKSELRTEWKSEAKMAAGLGVAAVCMIATLNLLLVALVLALTETRPGWMVALVVAAVMLALGVVAGRIGWSRRVRKPIERTQRTLKEDVQWAKERLT